jgi:hypothetical protein
LTFDLCRIGFLGTCLLNVSGLSVLNSRTNFHLKLSLAKVNFDEKGVASGMPML